MNIKFDMIKDYIHCMQDICYFAKKCYIITPEGLRKIELHDHKITYKSRNKENSTIKYKPYRL